jgi:Ras family protein T1
MPMSVKLGDSNSIFHRIVTAAEHPHLNIPKKAVENPRKPYHGLIDRSPMVFSGISFFGFTC